MNPRAQFTAALAHQIVDLLDASGASLMEQVAALNMAKELAGFTTARVLPAPDDAPSDRAPSR